MLPLKLIKHTADSITTPYTVCQSHASSKGDSLDATVAGSSERSSSTGSCGTAPIPWSSYILVTIAHRPSQYPANLPITPGSPNPYAITPSNPLALLQAPHHPTQTLANLPIFPYSILLSPKSPCKIILSYLNQLLLLTPHLNPP